MDAPRSPIALPRLLLVAALVAPLAPGPLGCKDDDGPRARDLDSVASACMRATACDVQAYARVGGCLYTFEELRLQHGEAAVMAAIYECVNGAETCDEVRDCFGAGTDCNSSFDAHCEGDTAVYCDLFDGVTYRYACGDEGLGCRTDPSTGYYATCTPDATAAASAHHLNTALDCDGTLCERTGEPCNVDDLDQCSGRHIVACVEGEIIHFDCYALGLRSCIMEENDWGHCRPQIGQD